MTEVKKKFFRRESWLTHPVKVIYIYIYIYIYILILFLKSMSYSDIAMSMVKSHQALLKSSNNLMLFKKYFYQEYLSWMTQYHKRNKETKHLFLSKKTLDIEKWIWYCLLYFYHINWEIMLKSDRFINSRIVFWSVSACSFCNEDKTLELR